MKTQFSPVDARGVCLSVLTETREVRWSTSGDYSIEKVVGRLLDALRTIIGKHKNAKWAVQLLIDSPWLTRDCPESVEMVVAFLEEVEDGWQAYRLRRYGHTIQSFTARLEAVVASSQDERAMRFLRLFLKKGPLRATGSPKPDSLPFASA